MRNYCFAAAFIFFHVAVVTDQLFIHVHEPNFVVKSPILPTYRHFYTLSNYSEAFIYPYSSWVVERFLLIYQ